MMTEITSMSMAASKIVQDLFWDGTALGARRQLPTHALLPAATLNLSSLTSNATTGTLLTHLTDVTTIARLKMDGLVPRSKEFSQHANRSVEMRRTSLRVSATREAQMVVSLTAQQETPVMSVREATQLAREHVLKSVNSQLR